MVRGIEIEYAPCHCVRSEEMMFGLREDVRFEVGR